MKPVRLLGPAEQEMLEAAQYYELHAPGLSGDFLDSIESAIQDIGENPERWPIVYSGVRRRLIRRFPFGLLYRSEPKEVIVLAVMHLHRRPSYWVDRL